MGDITTILLSDEESRMDIDQNLDGYVVRFVLARRNLMSKLAGFYKSDYACPQLLRDKQLSKGEKAYYEKQLSTLRSFEEVDRVPTDSPLHDDDEEKNDEISMSLSNFANVLLLLFKIYATIRSGSLAIAASTLDSLLDLISGLILWFTHLEMKKNSIYEYPIGKLRVQPVGIVVFAAIMATLGFQVLVEGVQHLIKSNPSKMTDIQLAWLYIIMLSATAIKFGLWLYCKTSKNEIIQAYAKDHFFDFVTNVVGLGAAVLGAKFYWWIDPAGAILLAIYTITNWSGTVYEKAASLIGKSAPPEVLQRLTYMVLRHSPMIKHVDTVRAYTFGNLYFAEVDIQLPEELPLKEAHLIGETLQNKIEMLQEFERAFVHLDFDCQHKPEVEHTVLTKLPPSQP